MRGINYFFITIPELWHFNVRTTYHRKKMNKKIKDYINKQKNANTNEYYLNPKRINTKKQNALDLENNGMCDLWKHF